MSDAKPQEIIYNIIKQNRIAGNPYITKTQILVEAKQTSLGAQDMSKYSGIKTKLQTQVDQAIMQLHKKGKIKSKSHGRWTIEKHPRIKQKVCRHIQKRENDRWWCPVKESFIGDPKSQCNVLYGSDVYSKPILKHGDGIIQIPRCVGFIDSKSNEDNIIQSKEALRKYNLREESCKRKKGESEKGLLV